MNGIFRIVRTLTYIGPEDWLKRQMASNQLKGRRELLGNCSIEETSVSEPEFVRGPTREEKIEAASKALKELDAEGLAEIERNWFSREEV